MGVFFKALGVTFVNKPIHILDVRVIISCMQCHILYMSALVVSKACQISTMKICDMCVFFLTALVLTPLFSKKKQNTRNNTLILTEISSPVWNRSRLMSCHSVVLEFEFQKWCAVKFMASEALNMWVRCTNLGAKVEWLLNKQSDLKICQTGIFWTDAWSRSLSCSF